MILLSLYRVNVFYIFFFRRIKTVSTIRMYIQFTDINPICIYMRNALIRFIGMNIDPFYPIGYPCVKIIRHGLTCFFLVHKQSIQSVKTYYLGIHNAYLPQLHKLLEDRDIPKMPGIIQIKLSQIFHIRYETVILKVGCHHKSLHIKRICYHIVYPVIRNEYLWSVEVIAACIRPPRHGICFIFNLGFFWIDLNIRHKKTSIA